jgi:hypothetical protein
MNRICTDHHGQDISDELKDFILVSGAIHKLTQIYLPKSIGIVERFT